MKIVLPPYNERNAKKSIFFGFALVKQKTSITSCVNQCVQNMDTFLNLMRLYIGSFFQLNDIYQNVRCMYSTPEPSHFNVFSLTQ